MVPATYGTGRPVRVTEVCISVPFREAIFIGLMSRKGAKLIERRGTDAARLGFLGTASNVLRKHHYDDFDS